MEEPLAQTIAAVRSMKAVDTRKLSRVIVDTTVREVNATASELNGRPRKVLDFLTPAEVS